MYVFHQVETFVMYINIFVCFMFLQLDEERKAAEAKDIKLREALIQAEAARRASVQALESEKKYENMQYQYKELLAQYAPGLGAGLLMEKAISKRVAEVVNISVRA